MTFNQKIHCPNCQAIIVFDTYALLGGMRFTCTNCNAQIGLASDSKDTVEGAMNKFEELKKNSL
ncbi:MAG: hypothetical protein JEZ14_20985, partial [Marinilabiliaceae bacterium]|nr:hypothetical protein [Marinilabiliaceae bacterium]